MTRASASRAIVVAAGPIANFLLAIVLFVLLFATAGRPIIIPIATGVLPGSAAERAGLEVNDRILSIAGEPIKSFEDIQRIISAHPADKLVVAVKRDGQDDGRAGDDRTRKRSAAARSECSASAAGRWSSSNSRCRRRSWAAWSRLGRWPSDTIVGVAQMITGQRGTEDLGGPLRIAQLSGQVAELGLGSLVSFIAVLSVNLGLINLFPIPVLDGGHLLFYLAEAIRGRPIPPRAQEYGFRAGLALLAGLFILATWNDLAHFGVFH